MKLRLQISRLTSNFSLLVKNAFCLFADQTRLLKKDLKNLVLIMMWKSIKSSSVYENLRNVNDGVELEH